jgi:hypothetical protein
MSLETAVHSQPDQTPLLMSEVADMDSVIKGKANVYELYRGWDGISMGRMVLELDGRGREEPYKRQELFHESGAEGYVTIDHETAVFRKQEALNKLLSKSIVDMAGEMSNG